jgi:hypothetical protein
MCHLSGKFRAKDCLAPLLSLSVVKGKQQHAEEVCFYLSLFYFTHVFFVTDFLGASSDLDQAILAEVCQTQATACQAIVTRHAMTHDKPS